MKAILLRKNGTWEERREVFAMPPRHVEYNPFDGSLTEFKAIAYEHDANGTRLPELIVYREQDGADTLEKALASAEENQANGLNPEIILFSLMRSVKACLKEQEAAKRRTVEV